ncbi:MAG: hypothetical protein NWT08_01530 [Akkermansiaceae bacterium]|jgi:hypothetical protein|nr:hypothetical protein [Akkermansiaceae bacterium]MDP4721258.1 hypothetical protein [Akkermansiaceae bacterium]MDP4778718.1 hypothetical protein [Akkermansiaceae bacterium]MDP4897869.1 hypothetical protein [Akkermansiaceae bacterium]MDP4996916.1 hypothetical protein [Akkermansiaceae bacterium]
MKRLANILIITFVQAFCAQAQDDHGFVNFVNMIPGKGKCEIRIDSKNPSGDGLSAGSHTGWFLYPSGSARVTVSLGDLDPIKGSIEIGKGVGSLIAVYLEPPPEPLKDGKPTPPALRIRSLPTYASEGLSLHFMTLCPSDNRFDLGTQRLNLEPFKTTDIPTWTGAGFTIKKNGKVIGEVSEMREKEPFYLLVGTDLEGKYICSLVFGGTAKTPPWRQKKKSDE